MHVEENTIAALNGATECSCNDKVKVGPADLPVVGLNSGKDSCRYTCGPSLFQDSQEDGRIIFPANNGLVATGTPVKLTYPSPSSSNHIQLVSGIIDKNGGNVTSNPDRPGPIVRTIWAVAQGPSRKGSICAVASLLCFPFCHQESSSETLCFFFHFICFGHSPNEGAAVATTNEHEPANSVNVHRHTTTLSQAER
uniref:Uncharacterized protein n=1 Tax=Kalanchoe fedtschenkoi TaxID=63787 RepID=A0A7N1A782_KALFE